MSVLPSSAWAVRQIRAYVPSHYAVCVDTSPPTDIAPLLSRLPARAEELLRDKSWTRSEGDIVEAREGGVIVVLGRAVTYCSKLATEEAREVDKALSGLDPDPRFPQDPLGYLVAEAVKNRRVGLTPTTIGFQPYLPHSGRHRVGPRRLRVRAADLGAASGLTQKQPNYAIANVTTKLPEYLGGEQSD